METHVSLLVKPLCHSMLTGLICGLHRYIKYME